MGVGSPGNKHNGLGKTIVDSFPALHNKKECVAVTTQTPPRQTNRQKTGLGGGGWIQNVAQVMASASRA